MTIRFATETTGTCLAYYVSYVSTKNVAEGKRLAAIYPDPCEYNPAAGRAAYGHELHAAAEVVVGKWRLCASCAALPEFGRYERLAIAKRNG